MAGKKIGLILALDGEKEFIQAVQTAKKESKLFETQLKGLADQYDGNANSLEHLQKKQELLTQQQAAYKRQLEASKSGLEKANSNYREQGKRLEELKKQLEEARNVQKQMEVAGETGSKAYDEQSKSAEKLEKAVENQTAARIKEAGSIADWEKKLYESERALEKSNKAIEDNEKYLKEAEVATDHCATSIDAMGKEVKQTEQSLEKFGDTADEAIQVTTTLGDKVVSAFVSKGTSLAVDALTKGVETVKESMYDASAASTKLAASTGLSESAMKKYNAVMKEIKGNNLGEDYSDISSVMAEIVQIMGELDSSAMQEVTESAIALRDTFGMDVNEQIRAVDIMMKTMGVDATKAFDLITTGAQRGLNRSGELTDNLAEYAQLWGQAGFSAEEMFAILENGLDSGAYNLDKVNDFVKEFGISLADGKIEENISSFSDGTKTLFEEWKNGNASTKDVFFSVISDLEKMENRQEALTIASETWSSLGEDNAMQVLTALNDVNDAYSDVKGSMESLKEVRYSDLESAVSGLGAALQENIVIPIANEALPVVTGLFEKATEVVQGIGTALVPQKTELDTFVDEIKASNDEVQTMLDNAKNTMSGATADVAELETYKSTILSLNGAEENNAYQKYQMKQAVDALSESMPELSAAFDEETGKIDMSRQAIENLFKTQEDLILQQAAFDAQKETFQAVIDSQINLEKATAAAKTAQDEYNEAVEKYGESAKTDETGYYNSLITEKENALKAANKELEVSTRLNEEAVAADKEIVNAVETAIPKIEEYRKEIDKETNSLEENDSATDANAQKQEQLAERKRETAEVSGKVTDALDGESDAWKNNEDAVKAAAEAQKEATSSILDTYHGYVDEIKADLQDKISLFDKFETSDGGEDQTVEKMTANLDSQIEAYQEYAENLAAVKDRVGKEIAPEFMQYLESMGMDGANTLKHILATFEEGDSGADKVKEMSDKWVQAMDMTESMAETGAANKLAYEAAMGELGSSDADFTALSDAVKEASSSAVEGWSELAAGTKTALEQTIQTAKDCGIQIPEGLTEGIASGEVSAEEAIGQLNGAIQGHFDGLAEVARKSGVAGVDELVAGIESGEQDVADAYNALLALMSSQTNTSQMNQKGQEEGAEYVAGLESTADAAGTAAGTVAQSATDALEQKQTEFMTAGTTSADQYVNALKAAVGKASQAGGDMARAARDALNAYQSSFQSAGYNIPAGVAVGIMNGQSNAVSAAANMARAALQAAKSELEIRSPSKKFRKEVGQNISESTAFGIKDKASLAGKAAAKMSNKVYTNAISWLAKYKKKQQTSLDDEEYYWKQVLKHVKKGTTAYNNAAKKLGGAIFDGTGLSSSSATKAAKKIADNFGVSKYTKSGKKKTKKSDDTYYSEIYSAAEKYLSNMQVLNDWSLEQELAYWNGVKEQLKSGTQAWYDATKQINSLQADIAAAEAKAAEEKVKTHANVQKDILDKYKVYYKVSAKAEMDYWNLARQQFKKGTDERIEADQNYLKACQEYYDQRKELDEEYAENSKDINEDLTKNIQDLQDAYHNAVQSRKQDILSSMNLFESWDASGYDSDTLLYNLKTQVAGLALWEQQLEELGKKGLSDALMEELSAMGPDAAANIYSLNQMTAEQLDEYNKLWEQKNTLAHSQALKDNEDLLKETNSEIINLRTEAQAELNALNADYRATLQELNTGISSELRNLVNKAGSIGEEAVSSLIDGIGKEATSVDAYNSTTQVVNQISSQLGTLKQEGKTIGASALDGLLAAMRDNDKINSASKQVIQSIKRAMEEEAEIHSPARLFRRETGPQIPAGVALGMEDGTKVAVRSAQEMMQDTLVAAQEEMRRQQAALQEQAGTLSYAGIARLNKLTEQYPQQTPVVNVDNSGLMGLMDRLITNMDARLERLENMQVVMDDTVIGVLQPKLSRENAMTTVRANRGRRR